MVIYFQFTASYVNVCFPTVTLSGYFWFETWL